LTAQIFFAVKHFITFKIVAPSAQARLVCDPLFKISLPECLLRLFLLFTKDHPISNKALPIQETRNSTILFLKHGKLWNYWFVSCQTPVLF
jgi:hypothetical protein